MKKFFSVINKLNEKDLVIVNEKVYSKYQPNYKMYSLVKDFDVIL